MIAAPAGRAAVWLALSALAVGFGCTPRPLRPMDGAVGGGTAGGAAGRGARGAVGTGGGVGGAALDAKGETDAATDAPQGTSANGLPCAGDRECASGFCTDGVCCQQRCADTCRTCVVAGAEGTCVPRPNGAVPRDPTACAATAASTCGQDGLCDGSGSCRLYSPGTVCAAGGCSADHRSVDGEHMCDGAGRCRLGPTIVCAPYFCDDTTATCADHCLTDADCSNGRPCRNGTCVLGGAACIADSECASDHCANGVCCNTACAGPCVSCNQPLREGTCSPLPVGTLCAPGSCADSVVSGRSYCDGAGSCAQGPDVACGPFTCDPATNLCRESCAADEQCGATYSCAGGSCGRRDTPTCDSDTQCVSGHCARGICCATACTDACSSCALPGSIGVCTPLPGGCPDAGGG